ncbi:granulin b [Engraulis encrasicolus]|uniref:granulin b n=1 Tax=Engraulis encrasicolus TaxID=184585 RepID=UPI002FD65840
MKMQCGSVCCVLLLVSVCSALICPDGGMCEDGDTCCKTPSGGYGCCPLPNAECCSDHLHCCFHGTLCDLVHSRCVNKTVSLPLVKRRPAIPALEWAGVGAVICPDQLSECPDGTTCCELPDSSWGCCPLAKAVCCEDKRHCCPENTKCDLEHSKCVSGTLGSTPMWTKFPARTRSQTPDVNSGHSITRADVNSGASITCPDAKSSCPDDTTCCLMKTGEYGCCPYPRAVCCSDQLHCCPNDTICDLEQGMCKSPHTDLHTLMALKLPGLRIDKNADRDGVSAVPCNDSVACPDGSTCCKIASGAWACCPLEEAVCCPDHIHCCPSGTVCNLRASTCDDPTDPSLRSVPWLQKFPAFPLQTRQRQQQRPVNTKCDETSSCPEDYTCCKTSTGGWGCCPLAEAVCCEDHMHCCPKDTVCNLAASTCDSSTGSAVPMVKKVPALTQPSLKRTNSDGRSAVPLERQVPSRELMCDADTSCPAHNTCCFMHTLGKWGCCPLHQAVCCSSGDHCCPAGLTCDAKRASCSVGRHEIPWYRKQDARVWVSQSAPVVESRATDEDEVIMDVKCDDKSTCAAGSTCCKLPTGDWGCCPLVKAVCCSDHEHCCPQGYTCKLESGTCVKPSGQLAPLPLSPLSKPPEQPHHDVQCDQVTRCETDQTCCRTSETSWACCPYKAAVCCADMRNCCPMGYTCDAQAKACTKGSRHLTWWDSVVTEKSRD